ncbi:DUF664 domain-containing protein [Streptomyces inhibens]|uniref:mycothiol transferase n=1 Tax=Streptomyces inhibens TaxID=2293571 RepID=UPI0036C0ACEE
MGLVQDMAEVERNWFQRVFSGLDVPLVYEEGKGDGFGLTPARSIGEALTTWRAEVARGRDLIAASSLDDSGKLSDQEAGHVGDQGASLRWILIRMIEEW